MAWKKPSEELSQYLILPDILYNDTEKFQDWLNRSFQYVSSLPSKKQKKNKEY